MKKMHRRSHLLVWLFLLPVLLGFVFFAQEERLPSPPATEVIEASAAGVLP